MHITMFILLAAALTIVACGGTPPLADCRAYLSGEMGKVEASQFEVDGHSEVCADYIGPVGPMGPEGPEGPQGVPGQDGDVAFAVHWANVGFNIEGLQLMIRATAEESARQSIDPASINDAMAQIEKVAEVKNDLEAMKARQEADTDAFWLAVERKLREHGFLYPGDSISDGGKITLCESVHNSGTHYDGKAIPLAMNDAGVLAADLEDYKWFVDYTGNERRIGNGAPVERVILGHYATCWKHHKTLTDIDSQREVQSQFVEALKGIIANIESP